MLGVLMHKKLLVHLQAPQSICSEFINTYGFIQCFPVTGGAVRLNMISLN